MSESLEISMSERQREKKRENHLSTQIQNTWKYVRGKHYKVNIEEYL